MKLYYVPGLEHEPAGPPLHRGEQPAGRGGGRRPDDRRAPQEPYYLELNPNGLVPTLVDDDFVLTESSTILKYLADKFNLPAYPKDLKKRARVNEMMDWFNTGFYRDYAYNVVYPQIYPHHKRPSDEMQKGTIEWGKDLTQKWLKMLNDDLARQGQQVPDRRRAHDRRLSSARRC